MKPHLPQTHQIFLTVTTQVLREIQNCQLTVVASMKILISCILLLTILEWICIALSKLCHYHQLSKRALLAICGLISTILFLISHPLYEIFPTSLQCVYSTMKYTRMKTVTYVVCPDADCNQLYQISDAQHHSTCTNAIFGKLCRKELGYKRHLSFSREKWTPFKTFHFVPPSV